MSFALSIVIPCFNKFNFTESCLNDLFKLPEDHEIIIVDNGSHDDTVTLKSIIKHNFKYIRNENNEGFARACNLGYKESSGSSVMFLNNDIRVKENHNLWTQNIINRLRSNLLIGPTIGVLDSNLNFLSEGSEFKGDYWYMSGWNISATKSTWQKLILPNHVGPFSTEFGQAYFEDTDLSFRAKELGITFAVQSVPVIHFGKITSQSVGLADLYLSAKDIFKRKWKSGKSL